MRSASVGFQCPSCVKEGSATIRDPKATYGGKARANPEITWVLMGLNALMFLATTLTGTGVLNGGNPSALFEKLALAPSFHCAASADGLCVTVADGVAQGEYWRLVTSNFLHFGVIHFLLNMYCLYLVGPALERAFGRLRYSALYLVSGIAGSALSYFRDGGLSAGASGAVFGLFAAFLVLQRKRGSDTSQIATTILINLVLSFTIPFIDWRGHVGGLIGGALVAAALVYAPAGSRRAALQAVGITVVAVAIAALVIGRTAALT